LALPSTNRIRLSSAISRVVRRTIGRAIARSVDVDAATGARVLAMGGAWGGPAHAVANAKTKSALRGFTTYRLHDMRPARTGCSARAGSDRRGSLRRAPAKPAFGLHAASGESPTHHPPEVPMMFGSAAWIPFALLAIAGVAIAALAGFAQHMRTHAH
jgi:hypothetical protein